MNESILPVTPWLLALLTDEKTGIKPFKQEIFLLEIVVAGTTFCKEIENPESRIVTGQILTMKREPANEYDPFAIALYLNQTRIGFVPADMNLVCSRLMDAGKLFFCRVVSASRKKSWLRIKANIYMVE